MLVEKRLMKAINLLWGLVLLTLPVTSFRFFPSFMGYTTVQPLAFYPLVILIPVLILYLWRRKEFPLPIQIVPLAAFLLVAGVVTMVGSLYAPLDLGDVSYWDRALRAWVTVGIGLAFFFTAFQVSYFQKSPKNALKWLYAGLAITILWAVVQALAIYTPLIERSLIDKIQLSFSLRPLKWRRVSGFAYEASWLADMLVILYFSWLAAALLSGYRISKYQWLEPILAAAGFVVLFLTYSRGGLISVFVAGGIVLLFTGYNQIKKTFIWFKAPFIRDDKDSKWIRVIILLGLVFFLVLGFHWLNRYDYFSSLWNVGFEKGFINYLIVNKAGARTAYAFAGIRTFSEHPWTGVGLGGSGFYMINNYPDWTFTILSKEIANQLGETFKVFPNSKIMYVRILAETGLVGFWLFIAFFISIFGSFYGQLRASDQINKFIGTAGLFGLIAVAILYFTLDSFALPIVWVFLGTCLGFAHRFPPKPI